MYRLCIFKINALSIVRWKSNDGLWIFRFFLPYIFFIYINRQIELNTTKNKNPNQQQPQHKMNSEDAQWLFMQYQHATNILLIDCRTLNEYSKGHIEGAINLFVPPLMLRRLKKGNVPLTNFVNSEVCNDLMIRYSKKKTPKDGNLSLVDTFKSYMFSVLVKPL